MFPEKQKPKEKKGISLKTKLIWAVIGVVILMGLGFYFGMRMQRAYNNFIFSTSQNMLSFSFWAVIILAVLLIIFILYLVFKIRHRK